MIPRNSYQRASYGTICDKTHYTIPYRIMPENIVIKSDEEARLRKSLEAKKDAESERLKRFLNIPDLTRTPGSPLHEMIERIVALPDFKNFDVIKVPEIVSTEV